MEIVNSGRFARKYSFNQGFFSIIDSEEKAYIFGYLLADGCNFEKRHSIQMSCAEKDRDILEKINNILNSTYLIKNVNIKNKTYCRLSFSSKVMSEDLAKLGCVQNKTFLINFIDLGNIQNHFIRGFFDGDGCVSYSFAKRDNCYGNSFLSVITFTSTDKFCLGLKKYIFENLGINSTILCRFPERNNNIRTLQISGNTQVKKLRNWMYNNSTIYLNRKVEKFKEIENLLKDRKYGQTRIY